MIAGLGLSVAAATGGVEDAAEPTVVNVPLDEARSFAVSAAMAGNTPVATALAGELLKADPNDPDAHLAMSTVHLASGNWDAAYKAGKHAFRYTNIEENKYHAARVAATAALADKRKLVAQYWLRRAGDVAPGPVQRAAVERNFAIMRAESPWSYKLRFSASPSSNVSGGSENVLNIIDGLDGFVGVLQGGALALSGLNVHAGVDLTYRLNRTDKSQTSFHTGLHLKRVFLSDEAKTIAPDFNAALLGSTALSFGMSHLMLVGKKPGTVLRFDVGLRDEWVDGRRYYTAPNAKLMYSRKLGENLRFTTQGAIESRSFTNGTKGVLGSATASLNYKLQGGSSVNGIVAFSQYDAPSPIFDSHSIVGKISYHFGEPVLGGIELAAGIGATYADYPNYTFIVLPVPGGRQDRGVFMDLEATFTQVEYAGFSPQLRLRRSVTDSNVSRYTTSEWAVSLGIESNF